MFAIDESGEGEEMPKLQEEVQPLLDWLSVNHHDFMRLNDFAGAFALLRWAKSGNVTSLIIDANGEAPIIATPDRVIVGGGPRMPAEVDGP